MGGGPLGPRPLGPSVFASMAGAGGGLTRRSRGWAGEWGAGWGPLQAQFSASRFKSLGS